MIRLLLFLLAASYHAIAEELGTCEWNDQSCYQDPHLKEIQVTLGENKKDTFLAYVTPDVSTFYQEEPGSRTSVESTFSGQCGKFINISPYDVRVYWSPGSNREDVYTAEIAPFESAATASFPSHRFIVKKKHDLTINVEEWTIVKGQLLYVHDPIENGSMQLSDLKKDELALYTLQKDNLRFSEQYKMATGRDYLSTYPLRPRPLHPQWPADYFGQMHHFATRETHFVELPPDEKLQRLKPQAKHEPILRSYREQDEFLNMTLKVLSCAPRVFEIQNFLSKTEIDHIMKIATGSTLHESSTKAGIHGESRNDASTRTSKNTWVKRGQSPIIDTIYRRAADLMHLDEAYLRQRQDHEMPHLPSKTSNAEQLQLVHYDKGQQYTPHHDFAMPSLGAGQPMRFATILFYLNEGMEGGETTFPRWRNAEDSSELKVIPEVGKAILFYNLLPDGNPDDLSQHAAKPVRKGEKWLINLWTWDPRFKF
mmetsp:Transcript_21121/g.32044  ORF Transcript_21121/g.32044 Transcript_21121/m.32044 type:complete len:482 (-) Transcript_21121:13-1458(-)